MALKKYKPITAGNVGELDAYADHSDTPESAAGEVKSTAAGSPG